MDKENRQKIIDYILGNGIIELDSILEPISPISIEAIGLINSLKGFIIRTYKIIPDYKKNFMFFLYSKIPGKLFYYLSDDEYYRLEDCKKDMEQYIKLFPLYGFRKSHCRT